MIFQCQNSKQKKILKIIKTPLKIKKCLSGILLLYYSFFFVTFCIILQVVVCLAYDFEIKLIIII